VASSPGGQPPQTRFSADGLWWWDGTEWKPAISPDRHWRWNGQGWVPATPAGGGAGGAGLAIGLTVLAFVGVLFLVAVVVIVILLTIGNQLANVFSNVAAALGSPSP
jgi:Flp pilus assembly pilin Flp